jgi:hypothetical protein
MVNSFPPAVLAPSSGSGRSRTTTFQFASAGCLGSIRTMRVFGASLLVATSSLSPTLSMTL